MKPRRTHESDLLLRLPGGNEDNDLYVETMQDDSGKPVLASTWEPSATERRRIAEGSNIQVILWGRTHPPIALAITDVPLGKPPKEATT